VITAHYGVADENFVADDWRAAIFFAGLMKFVADYCCVNVGAGREHKMLNRHIIVSRPWNLEADFGGEYALLQPGAGGFRITDVKDDV